jgi:hypothetical protein
VNGGCAQPGECNCNGGWQGALCNKRKSVAYDAQWTDSSGSDLLTWLCDFVRLAW